MKKTKNEPIWKECAIELPLKSDRYLVTGKKGTVYVLDYDATIDRWYGGMKPVAWAYLPEPYKGETKE